MVFVGKLNYLLVAHVRSDESFQRLHVSVHVTPGDLVVRGLHLLTGEHFVDLAFDCVGEVTCPFNDFALGDASCPAHATRFVPLDDVIGVCLCRVIRVFAVCLCRVIRI